MSTDKCREALADAAKSLECISESAGFSEYMDDMTKVRAYARSRAMAARAALAQPAEPVAHMWQHPETGLVGFVEHAPMNELAHWEHMNRPRKIITPLYANPQAEPAEPAALTDEQIRDLVKECGLDWHKGYMPLFDGDETNRYAVLARAIERAVRGQG